MAGEESFVSKTAAAVLAFVGLTLFSIPMSAQLIPHGNVYAGVGYVQFTEVIDIAAGTSPSDRAAGPVNA